MAEIEAMDLGLPGDPLWPVYAAEAYARNNASEDCLYVDIWAPRAARTENLAVKATKRHWPSEEQRFVGPFFICRR